VKRIAATAALGLLTLVGCSSTPHETEVAATHRPADDEHMSTATAPAEPIAQPRMALYEPKSTATVTPVALDMAAVPDGFDERDTDVFFAWREEAAAPIISDYRRGRGVPAAFGDTLLVNYAASLRDGTEICAFLDPAAPVELEIFGEQMEEWQLHVVGMRPGGVRTIELPAWAAFGDHSPHLDDISAEATVFIDIELLEFKAIAEPPRGAIAGVETD
jgi:hypothetical protein